MSLDGQTQKLNNHNVLALILLFSGLLFVVEDVAFLLRALYIEPLSTIAVYSGISHLFQTRFSARGPHWLDLIPLICFDGHI